MEEYLPIILAGTVLVAASITDIRTREVPDWINYFGIASGIGINLIYSIITWSIWPIAFSAIGIIAFFAVASLMFYAGQWGGGDSKLLIALGAILGLEFSLSMPFIDLSQHIVSIWMNLMVIGILYALIWSFGLAIVNMKDFSKQFTEQAAEVKTITITLFSAIMVLIIVIGDRDIRIAMLGGAVASGIALLIWIFGKSVEKSCMLKYVRTDKLTEGDWIAKDVLVKGKYICGPKDLGIERKQIRQLKKMNIRRVMVKEGIPFVPAFFISFLVTLKFGNLLLLAFQMI
ncbi:prepilin peptidase [Candidatus Woesearchaeota archaeon]|nr:prepilin peptidase [Candidatus Woesearchaeota archaeon]